MDPLTTSRYKSVVPLKVFFVALADLNTDFPVVVPAVETAGLGPAPLNGHSHTQYTVSARSLVGQKPGLVRTPLAQTPMMIHVMCP